MPQLQDVLKQIAELDPVEREGLVLQLSERMFPFSPVGYKWLAWRHAEDYPSIVKTPNVCGGAARLIRTRIPVWTLERMRQLGISEAEILGSYPPLQALDLVQAWSYVERHRNEIEQSIRENEEE